MFDEHRRRIDELLHMLRGDENAFNRIAEVERFCQGSRQQVSPELG